VTPDAVVHIALRREWEEASASGSYRRSTRGRSLDEVGFIHCARPSQVPGVLARFYRDEPEPLVLLTLEPARLGAEIVEEVDPATGEAFPHLYGPIPVEAVVDVSNLER
jgi:uncharacterized protein (DUF952 family)